jgi:hypothetical protein
MPDGMTSKLVHAAVGSLIAIAVASPSSALGELAIKTPHDGSLTNDSTPRFSGTTAYTLEESELEEIFAEVRVKISSGDHELQTLTASPSGADWSVVTGEPLADGTYTAQATQTNGPIETPSTQVSFSIDATAPSVTMTSPANGSSTSSSTESFGGTAGTAPGDASLITIRLFAGQAIGSQAPLETLAVQASGESWSAAVGGLVPGSYAAQATQSDLAGNTGSSAPVSFTIAAPAAAPPPSASFTWFPRAPRTGEPVSLVSSSTDPLSPIVGFAWAFSSSGPLAPGNPVLITAFANPGAHVVRLSVTDAEGRSSIATQTISVTGPPRTLMQPFPIVRIAGSLTSGGAKVKLLTVQAPVAARVTIRCRGRGCRTASETRTASASSTSKQKPGAVLLSFHRFERSYRAGTVLTILVAKPGQIGKYTSFAIRRHRLPVRTDSCLAANSTPVACTSS